MTIFKKMKYKVAAALMAAGMVLGAGSVTAFADDAQTQANIRFEAGQLVLIEADSISFGTQKLSSANETYAASANTAIKIGDNRGANTGWTLTAELGEFKIGNDPALANATIKVSTASATPLNGNTGTPPTANNNLALVAGKGAVEVAYADANEGTAGWQINWAAANTSLTVYGDTARVGTATAQIDWVLADVA